MDYVNLPEYFFINGIKFNVFGIFVVLCFLLVSYVVWSQGKRDGFSEERLFDTFVLSSLFGLFFSRFFFGIQNNLTFKDLILHVFRVWVEGASVFGYLLGVGIFLYLASRLLKWSIYRVLDIYSVGYSLGLSVIMLGYLAFEKNFNLLFAFSSYLFLFAILHQFRTSNFRSGYAFSFFILINVFISAVFYRTFSFYIWYGLGALLGLGVFYIRSKDIIFKKLRKTNG